MVKRSASTVPITDVVPSLFKCFSCGTAPLDEYLKRFAKGNHKKGFSKTFVLVNETSVEGYYCISMASVEWKKFPEATSALLPKYPIPVALIGRLAVDKSSQGKRIGEFLLMDAIKRICDASEIIGTYAVVVDAKDENARCFYEKYGFISCQNHSNALFLPLQEFKKAFNQS